MNEIMEKLAQSHGGIVRSYSLRSFKLMGQTISIGIIRDRAPERMQDDVKVFVNRQYYMTLHFPLPSTAEKYNDPQ